MEEKKLYPKKSRRPVTAIRYFCFECMGWDRRFEDSGKPIEEVKNCSDKICPLYDFRFGKNPFHRGHPASEKSIATLRKLGGKAGQGTA